MIPMNETTKLGAMPLRGRSAPLRAEPLLHASQAKRAAAIAGVCDDLLARQHERNVRILKGEEE